jgi:hypothetical protein
MLTADALLFIGDDGEFSLFHDNASGRTIGHTLAACDAAVFIDFEIQHD